MLIEKFIEKYRLELSPAEAKLCEDAQRLMASSVDVYHNETHIYRILDFLDEFFETKEHAPAAKNIDLKILLIAILWHDVWKSQRDPENILAFIWTNLSEGVRAALKFKKAAKLAGLDRFSIKKIGYIIRKHSFFQLIPIKGIEARLLANLDAMDGLNLDRVYLLEEKYLYDRPATPTNIRLARLAIKLFSRNLSDNRFLSDWAKEKYNSLRETFLNKARIELEEYEILINFNRKGEQLEYEKHLKFMREKYLLKAEKVPENQRFEESRQE